MNSVPDANLREACFGSNLELTVWLLSKCLQTKRVIQTNDVVEAFLSTLSRKECSLNLFLRTCVPTAG